MTRGYAASRVAYDARRRATSLTAEDRLFKEIVQLDPCAFCGRLGADTAADHIDGLGVGGRNEWRNFGGVCRACNASKRSTPLLLFMLRRLDGDGS